MKSQQYAKKKYKRSHNSTWTKQEDLILLKKAKEYNYRNWKQISSYIPNRDAVQCLSRFKRIRPGLKKGSWSQQEDMKVLKLIDKFGKNWSKLSKNLKNRTGKQIRDRYLNILDPSLNKAKFTQEEDQRIINLYNQYGSSWANMTCHFEGRTGEMIKNRFYSSLKKKYKETIIKPILDKHDHYNINNKNECKGDNSVNKIEYKNFEIEVLLKQLNAISEFNNINAFHNQLSIINELLENSLDKLDNQVVDMSTLDL